MEKLDYKTARGMLICSAQAIIDAKVLLTEVDSRIGDGDHGIGMQGGMTKAKAKLESMEDGQNVYDLFSEMGKAMLMSMGGASGVIFGSMFMGGAKGTTPVSEISPADFAEFMQRSLDTIKARGKAQMGDKTMVDALEPAVVAMRQNAGDFETALAAAEKAAAEGVENTKQYQAKFGRSKSLMERAIGYQDAGATSVWIIFRAMHDFIKGA